MQANYVQRLRLLFSKVGPTRFIGHLDLARTLERSLNRARIPLAYTQGYNKRPRLQLAAALPLGFTSAGELADIWLLEKMDPAVAQQQIMSKMAPGIVVHQVFEAPLDAPALQTLTAEATYRVTLTDLVDRADLDRRVEALLASETLARSRRGKSYDLRPLLLELEVDESEEPAVVLAMRLSLLPAKTGRPDEVLEALELDPLAARIHRTEIILASEPVAETTLADMLVEEE
ncbi:MAG: TIGR03936 family radical SAM-associated protein [Chloroflexi bacterium]|nr:TIGR03936 family radical SAM-associated protein [Chloroflexota bacterium]MCI0575434.1 TIGR03936 family radical SAM-associated protein [Chloroflexota bacterium]MCI0649884.1 TIGR03936 family radical SAM-associated protein [Chloroflexota bacterium]MCI0725654.1 TIGR03936 family radical SAM-associated protein [Chloroflexota bacterium]